ncbi:carboxypeptidase-like regulatory domain-containing protein [Robiginitalea sp. SC105]|uniref:carboxypeptidase-like regulatory domain-containing protein n=1 Tax=Robiginitalea sp. SC105 TaxID=2762332 RepID=UPI00163B3792|nr:carboxypeptidase-like regulatory domain-containing protein [Robiginitalea sp. SC105]MBC2839782.1 TonB-dependent receptor [Robiginitalea sp. SC105]
MVALVIGSSRVAAQEFSVSGTVSDNNGPLMGAAVVEKGTTNGTQTDFEGHFSLEISGSNASLEISYVGYAIKEVPVNGQTTLNITLEVSDTYLDEVIVIGYGTTTEADATGALVAVKEEQFNRGVINSPEQLIQGKAAGVQITVSSGEPGAGIQTRIRGSNSIRSGNNPLFVVDGIPLDGGATATFDSDRPPRNPLNFLNPSEIESISILKDASATAIYGSRSANGVVIITTKSGKSGGQGVFEFSSAVSIATAASKFDLLNREEYLAGISRLGGDAEARDFGGDTDWQEFVTRTSISENLNLSWSKNYGSGNFFASIGYQDQYGIIKKSSLKRINGRFNWSQRFFRDRLELGFRGTLTEVKDEAFSPEEAFFVAYRANPTIPASLDFNSQNILTPSEVLEYQQVSGSTKRSLLNVSVAYDLTPEISTKIVVGYDDSRSTTNILNSGENADDFLGSDTGKLFNIEKASRLLEATVTYEKDFENHSLDALVGYAYQSFRTSGRNSTGRGFESSSLKAMGNELRNTVRDAAESVGGSFQQFFYGSNWETLKVNRLFPDVVAGQEVPFRFSRRLQAVTADYYNFTDELQSFFGRVNYSIAGKYFLTATLRADGSSRFGPENQYGFFPSGAFAWQIGDEDFIGNRISTLKLRISAGLIGNQEGIGYGNFVARQRFSDLEINLDGSVNQNGLSIVATDVPDLRWETTLDVNIGIDWGLNLDRLEGSINVYRRRTTDLLLQTPPAAPSTNPFQFGNVDALVINKGIEFSFFYDLVQSVDTGLWISLNASYNHNEIQDFRGAINTGAINGPGVTGSFAQRFESGRSLASFYMAEFTGFDSAGNPTYRDIDGNGIGNPDVDKFFVGEDGLPDITSGLSLNLRHKNWSFSAFFNAQFGFSVYNNTANAFFNTGQLSTSQNVTRDVLASSENPASTAVVSTRFLEKGDFVRFQNATVSYKVPLGNTGTLESLILNITGQNLFLITGYSGLDPEINTNGANFLNGIPTAGLDYLAYPRPRTITLGVTAKF